MELEKDRKDRDYLYGRLLAVAENIESLARYKKNSSEEKKRPTNAIRYMTAFARNPYRTWYALFTDQINPYLQQLSNADWYLKIIGENMRLFEQGVFEDNTALDGRYLLGYFAQRVELNQQRKENNKVGEELK